MSRWLIEPVPRGRVAAFRTLIYLFVAADLVIFTPWVRSHAAVPGELYQPLLVGRLLPLPTPTPLLVHAVFWAAARCSRWPPPPGARPGCWAGRSSRCTSSG